MIEWVALYDKVAVYRGYIVDNYRAAPGGRLGSTIGNGNGLDGSPGHQGWS